MNAAGHPMLEVWHADLTALAAGLDRLSMLDPGSSPAKRTAGAVGADDASIDRDKHRARLALRVVLALRIGRAAASRPFVVGKEGKPRLGDEAGIDFSLSHAGGLALIAVSGAGPVGVDLELPRPVRIAAERRAQLEACAEAIGATPLPVDRDSDSDARTLTAWVRLEALAKATGEGIGSLLGRLGARPGNARMSAEAARAALGPFRVVDLTLTGAGSAALAAPAALLATTGMPPVVRLATQHLVKVASAG
jgi:4'-phosphopantetheinyl transferase